MQKIVRIIYYDLSEWFGDTENFNTSPHKGILSIMVSYPDSPYRHLLSAADYYYVKNEKIGKFNGEEKNVNLIVLKGPGKETTESVPVSQLDFAYLRMGVWVDDRTIRIADKRILEREE